MNRDQLEGAAKQNQGTVKETAGKLAGDSRLEAEGKLDKTQGTIQRFFGRIRRAFTSD